MQGSMPTVNYSNAYRFALGIPIYAQHALMTATAFCSCSIGILRAGRRRSLSLALMTSTPFSRQAAMMSDAFFSV